jgi:hypothetical protein
MNGVVCHGWMLIGQGVGMSSSSCLFIGASQAGKESFLVHGEFHGIGRMIMYWYVDRWHTQRDMGLHTTEIAEYSEAQCTSRIDTVSCG